MGKKEGQDWYNAKILSDSPQKVKRSSIRKYALHIIPPSGGVLSLAISLDSRRFNTC